MSQTLKINGFSCRYELSGNPDSDQTIVLLNGIASPLEAWNTLRDELADTYQLLAFDHRGQWFSEVTPGPYSLTQHADDTAALMQALGIERAHIIGTSLGSEIGMYLALRHPQCCQSLTVIAGVSEVRPVLREQVIRWINMAQDIIDTLELMPDTPDKKLLGHKLGRRFFDFFLADTYADATLTSDYELIHARAKAFELQVNIPFYRGFILLCNMFLRLEKEDILTPELNRIACPTLFIAGGKDNLKVPDYTRIMAEQIKDSEHIVFADAGHGVAVEKQTLIADLCRGFMRRAVRPIQTQ
jgi:3-oxoadipate enol-lactonase